MTNNHIAIDSYKYYIATVENWTGTCVTTIDMVRSLYIEFECTWIA